MWRDAESFEATRSDRESSIPTLRSQRAACLASGCRARLQAHASSKGASTRSSPSPRRVQFLPSSEGLELNPPQRSMVDGYAGEPSGNPGGTLGTVFRNPRFYPGTTPGTVFRNPRFYPCDYPGTTPGTVLRNPRFYSVDQRAGF